MKNNITVNDDIRIKTKISDNEQYINVQLKNTFNFLNILSLKISQSDIYRLFTSNYGVLVGRVVANGGTGIPNTKISLFIPLSENDKNIDTTDINNIKIIEAIANYPFETVYDEDSTGKRYNILPKNSTYSESTEFPDNDYGIGFKPKTPVGSLPIKEELLTNESYLYVFENYLKYTTVTNKSGDFMLFGVPVGSYILHYDLDLTDIGQFSTHPLIMSRINGMNENLFSENGSLLIKQNELEKMPNIITQNISVDIKPLWTQDTDLNEIGITKRDIFIKENIKPYFTIFGSTIMMNKDSYWGDRVRFRLHYGLKNLCKNKGWGSLKDRGYREGDSALEIDSEISFTKFRFGVYIGIQFKNIIPFFKIQTRNEYCDLDGDKFDLNPYDIINHGRTDQCTLEAALDTIPSEGITDKLNLEVHRTTNLKIDMFSLSTDLDEYTSEQLRLINPNFTNNLNIEEDIIHLKENKDFLVLNENGKFIIMGLCNRKKVITDEEGNLIESQNGEGIFSEFRGYSIIESTNELTNPKTKDRVGTIKLKIPQSFDYNNSENPNDKEKNIKKWISQHSIFKTNKIYSVACNIPVKNEDSNDFNRKTGILLNVNPNISNRQIELGYDYTSDNNTDDNGVLPNENTNTGTTDTTLNLVNGYGNFYGLVFICIDQLIYNRRDFTIDNRTSTTNTYNDNLKSLALNGSNYYGSYLDRLESVYNSNYTNNNDTTLNNYKRIFIQYRDRGRADKSTNAPDVTSTIITGSTKIDCIIRTAYYYGYRMANVTTNPITNDILINQPAITFYIDKNLTLE
jgi:hypothetical protein